MIYRRKTSANFYCSLKLCGYTLGPNANIRPAAVATDIMTSIAIRLAL